MGRRLVSRLTPCYTVSASFNSANISGSPGPKSRRAASRPPWSKKYSWKSSGVKARFRPTASVPVLKPCSVSDSSLLRLCDPDHLVGMGRHRKELPPVGLRHFVMARQEGVQDADELGLIEGGVDRDGLEP
jgi:hypothetical protein